MRSTAFNICIHVYNYQVTDILNPNFIIHVTTSQRTMIGKNYLLTGHLVPYQLFWLFFIVMHFRLILPTKTQKTPSKILIAAFRVARNV